jgi:branched-chain amino acid transport system ATP-binding protein
MNLSEAPVVAVERLRKSFGSLVAVQDVSFAIGRGELIGLIGPNGSGKTTVLNMMSGLVRPDTGNIRLSNKPVTGTSADRLARSGMVRMFQLTRVFTQMTVLDNLLTCGLARGLNRAAATARAHELLDDLKIGQFVDALASELSGGQQKLLEFACCFMRPPQLALLDEPFAAIHPTMRLVLADYIQRSNAAGQTYLIVSHDMPVVVDLCPRAICLAAGAVLADGPTASVLQNPSVIEAYLGPHHQ